MEHTQLQQIAKTVRQDIIREVYSAGSGHPGGSLSAADLLTALYFSEMRIDPAQPAMEDRDRFVLSKGHAAPALYACLAERGFFPKEDLVTLRKIGSRLQGHPSMKMLPGVEMSTGSLGHGLATAAGMAMGAKLDGKTWRTWCVLGDGECDEGSVWEAALQAHHYGLDNLIAVVDHNRMQSLDFCENTLRLEPFADKWKAFGWRVLPVNGHDIDALTAAFAEAQAGLGSGQPTVVLAETVKGKGVSFMENNILWHYRSPQGEEYEAALKELEAQRP